MSNADHFVLPTPTVRCGWQTDTSTQQRGRERPLGGVISESGEGRMDVTGGWSVWSAVSSMFTGLVAGARKNLNRRRSARRLRLSETLSLGEKRFLAVVQFQQQEFLVGGTGNSIALLAKLNGPEAPDSLNNAQQAGV